MSTSSWFEGGEPSFCIIWMRCLGVDFRGSRSNFVTAHFVCVLGIILVVDIIMMNLPLCPDRDAVMQFLAL